MTPGRPAQKAPQLAGFATLEEDVGISAGQGAAGMEQAFEVAGGRLGGKFEVDSLALDGPQAMERPGGGADSLDRVLLDAVARGDAQHVLADQILEALARLGLEDGGFGEVVPRERLDCGAALPFLGFEVA